MKITDLISILEECKNGYGNIEVGVHDTLESSINGIEFDEQFRVTRVDGRPVLAISPTGDWARPYWK